MKKLIAIILAVILLMGVFGCGPKKTADDQNNNAPNAMTDRQRQMDEATSDD